MNIDVRDVNDWYLGRANWTTADLKQALFHAQDQAKSVDAYLATVLENHDQPRVLSKLVPEAEWQTSRAAKALATMYFLLRGVPLIYQGQEIGMKNFHRQSIEEFNDVSSLDNYRMALAAGFSEEQAIASVNAKSRDNARVPMQWDDSQTVGFTTGKPWLAIGDDRDGINVTEQLSDTTSTLNFYRELVAVRQDASLHDLFVAGELVEITDVPDNIVAYDRVLNDQVVHVRVNLGTTPQIMTGQVDTLILNNIADLSTDADAITLAPYQAVVYR
jgi:alpha-glucosidase